MIGTRARLVVAEDDIHAPVQAVLNAPVLANDAVHSFGVRSEAAEINATFDGATRPWVRGTPRPAYAYRNLATAPRPDTGRSRRDQVAVPFDRTPRRRAEIPVLEREPGYRRELLQAGVDAVRLDFPRCGYPLSC